MAEWTTPVTDWQVTDRFNIADYNRIKNNLEYLYELADSKYFYLYGLKPSNYLGDDLTETTGIWDYSDFNKFESFLTHLNEYTYNFDIGDSQTFKANGQFITYDELNRIESACLRLYNVLDKTHYFYDTATKDSSYYIIPDGENTANSGILYANSHLAGGAAYYAVPIQSTNTTYTTYECETILITLYGYYSGNTVTMTYSLSQYGAGAITSVTSEISGSDYPHIITIQFSPDSFSNLQTYTGPGIQYGLFKIYNGTSGLSDITLRIHKLAKEED